MSKAQGGRSALAISAAVVILIPLLYVLSFGPAAGLLRAKLLSHGVFSVIYYPLIEPARYSDSLNDALVWYAKVFGTSVTIHKK